MTFTDVLCIESNCFCFLLIPIPVTRTPIQKSGCTNNDGAQTAFVAGSKYKSNSVEQHVKEQALALWIGRTGLPACTIDDEDFIHMMETFDKG